MVKLLVTFFTIFVLTTHLVIATENVIVDNDIPAIPLEVADPAADPDTTISVIEQMYRSTMVSVLKQKLSEVQKKVTKGENALPEAIDILKIAILSQPTNNVTIRKAAENVISKITPQLGKAASTLGGILETPEVSTKESPKSD